jgi:phage baseplate assembly protein W
VSAPVDPLATRLGIGWAFPVVPTQPRGALAEASGAELVRQSVRLILATEPGERIHRPAFGCGLRRFLMAPNTPGTRAAIAEVTTAALTSWEPRIQLQRVDVSPAEDPSVAVLTVSYVHVRDGSQGTVQLAVPVAGPSVPGGGR